MTVKTIRIKCRKCEKEIPVKIYVDDGYLVFPNGGRGKGATFTSGETLVDFFCEDCSK